MTTAFDVAALASRLVHAGHTPEAAAAYAALFEELIMNAIARKAQIAALQAQVQELRREIGAGTGGLREAVRQETAPLLTSKAFDASLSRRSYFTYLENAQLAIVLAILSVAAVIVFTILKKFF